MKNADRGMKLEPDAIEMRLNLKGGKRIYPTELVGQAKGKGERNVTEGEGRT
jgi:hypothetical protein